MRKNKGREGEGERGGAVKGRKGEGKRVKGKWEGKERNYRKGRKKEKEDK